MVDDQFEFDEGLNQQNQFSRFLQEDNLGKIQEASASESDNYSYEPRGQDQERLFQRGSAGDFEQFRAPRESFGNYNQFQPQTAPKD